MAKLKIRVQDLEGVEDAMRGFYREHEQGGFILDTEPDPDGYGIDNIAKMRGQLDEARRKKAATEGKLLTKDDGSLYTREEIEALQSQLSESSKLVATLKDKDKSVEEKFAERLRSEIKPLQDKLTRAEQQMGVYRSKVHDAEASRVVDKLVKQLNPLPEWEGLLRRELRAHVKVEESDDGSINHTIINPETGEPRYSSMTGVDGPMGLEEFAKDKGLLDTYGRCLRGDDKDGGGPIGNPSGKNPGAASRKGRDVVIPAGADQTTFENAYKQAKEQGGEVLIDDGGGAR